MNTKQRILDEALTLFSQKGYTNVFVGEIAEKVGIKAPSLYKHYKSKQAIFEAILDEMEERYQNQMENLGLVMEGPDSELNTFASLSSDELVCTITGLFMFFLHDDYTSRIRKMLTIEQYNNCTIAEQYTKQYVTDPLSFQGMVFGMLAKDQALWFDDDIDIMTLQFYAPIYMLLTICDRNPEQEDEALKKLEAHIRLFDSANRKREIGV